MKSMTDDLLRKLTIGSGVLAMILFLVSLVALIEFPALFKYLAIGMIVASIAFLVLRSANNYRNTFKIKERK